MIDSNPSKYSDLLTPAKKYISDKLKDAIKKEENRAIYGRQDI